MKGEILPTASVIADEPRRWIVKHTFRYNDHIFHIAYDTLQVKAFALYSDTDHNGMYISSYPWRLDLFNFKTPLDEAYAWWLEHNAHMLRMQNAEQLAPLIEID